MQNDELKMIVSRCLKQQKRFGMWKSCFVDGYPPFEFYGLIRGSVSFFNVPTKRKKEKTINLELIFTDIYSQLGSIEEYIKYSHSLDKADIIEARYFQEEEGLSLKKVFKIDSADQLKDIITPKKWKYEFSDITHWIYAGSDKPFDHLLIDV